MTIPFRLWVIQTVVGTLPAWRSTLVSDSCTTRYAVAAVCSVSVGGRPVTSNVTGRPESRIRRTRDGTSSQEGDLSDVDGMSGSRSTSR